MPEPEPRVVCPICKTLIPVTKPVTDPDDPRPFDVDPEPARKHVHMHAHCGCQYVEASGDRIPSPACFVHGLVRL